VTLTPSTPASPAPPASPTSKILQKRPIPPPPPPRIGDARTPTSEPATTPTPPTASDERCSTEVGLTTITIRPWIDPLVDDGGHDPRSRYVEVFWLGVLGPTATWLVRRLSTGLTENPDGYTVDLAATAKMMGLSYSTGRSSPFSKALQRCTMFGLAHQTSDGLAIRRRIPTVAHRHLRRMPPEVQAEHAEWERSITSSDDIGRAHQIAIAMLDAGDDADAIERQLVAVGVSDAVAAEVADNAARL